MLPWQMPQKVQYGGQHLQSPLVPVKNLDGTWAGNYTVGGYTYTG